MLVDPVARPYAEALFEIAKQQSQVDEIGQELSEFRGLVEREAEMAAFLASPVIEPSVKSGHLRKAIDGRVSDTVANTLCLLVEKGRFAALGRIVDAYLAMADDHAGRVRVSVKTAVPLYGGVERGTDHHAANRSRQDDRTRSGSGQRHDGRGDGRRRRQGLRRESSEPVEAVPPADFEESRE